MARFYATIKGSRGEASRLGTPASGITSHTRGWNLGARVEMNAREKLDTCEITLTGGSSGAGNLGVTIDAFEEEGPRVRVVVHVPGHTITGYVGDGGWKIQKE